jgi:hypothetical protein
MISVISKPSHQIVACREDHYCSFLGVSRRSYFGPSSLESLRFGEAGPRLEFRCAITSSSLQASGKPFEVKIIDSVVCWYTS